MAEYDSFSDDTLDGGKFINNLFGGGNDSEDTIGSETFINNLFNDENYDIVGGNDSEGTIGEDTFINNLFNDENHDIVGGNDSEGTIGEDTFINNLLEIENYEDDMGVLDGGFLSNLFNLFSDELSDSEGGGKFSLPSLKKKDSIKKQPTESVFFIDSKNLTKGHILKMTKMPYTLERLVTHTDIIKLDKSYYDILKSIGAWEKIKGEEGAHLLSVGPTIGKKISGHAANIKDTTGKHSTSVKTGTLKHVGKAIVGVSHVPSAIGNLGDSIKSYGKGLQTNKLKGGNSNPYKSLFDKLPFADTQFIISEHDGDAWLIHVYSKNIATSHHDSNTSHYKQPETKTVSNIFSSVKSLPTPQSPRHTSPIKPKSLPTPQSPRHTSPTKPKPIPPSKPHNSILHVDHHATSHDLPPSDLPPQYLPPQYLPPQPGNSIIENSTSDICKRKIKQWFVDNKMTRELFNELSYNRLLKDIQVKGMPNKSVINDCLKANNLYVPN